MAPRGETRERMVATAALTLREHGVDGTTFARVIEAGDLPRGSIGHHFPDGKKQMVAEAAGWAGNVMTHSLKAALEGGASLNEVITMVCDYAREGLRRSSFRAGCPVGAVAHEGFDDPELRAAAAGALRGWRETIAAACEVDAPESVADTCIAAIEGAVMMARVERSLAPIDHVERSLLRLLDRR